MTSKPVTQNEPPHFENNLKITNEIEAFEYLEKALNEELAGNAVKIEFNNWPVLTFSLQGDGYDSTITSQMAEALVDLQHAMNRVYARTIRGSKNPNVLTLEQKRSIAFKAKVEKGSSLVTVDMGDFMSDLAMGLVGKMDGTQIVVTVIGLAVAAGAHSVAKAWMQQRSNHRTADLAMQERLAMSAAETSRLVIFQKALTDNSFVRNGEQDFSDARHSFVKGVADASSMKFQGVELLNSQARIIASTPRTAAEEVQLNGDYRINKLDWTKEGEVRISLFGTNQALEFTARLNTATLMAPQKEMLKASEWDRRTLHLQINATKLRGEVTTATIVGIDWPKPVE